MNVSPSKENILKKIRKALTQSTPLPFPASEKNQPVFHPSKQELEIEFAEEFTKLQGKFVFCVNKEECLDQLKNLITQRHWNKIYCREDALIKLLNQQGIVSSSEGLSDCDASITSCESLVARTGSMVLSSALQSGRTVSVYAPVHICIAQTNQLVYDVKDALESIKAKYGSNLPSMMSFATGPSRTADIEKTLVVGVHGPKEVFCFLIDEPF